jgi:hypothetical protein
MAGGINYLLYPTAFSVEPIALLPGTEFYNITLADSGALFKGAAVKPNTGKIRLDMSADSRNIQHRYPTPTATAITSPFPEVLKEATRSI